MLIAGAGVDLDVFHPHPEPPGPPVVVMAARLLAAKGLREFVAAARMLRIEGISARFQVAGAPDPQNPDTIDDAELGLWKAEGVVEWLGHRSDMAEIYAQAHIACLPSYREGLPKALLEAMAAGLPVIATNVVGCRSAVTPGVTGLLVPPRDAAALAAALKALIFDRDLRQRFGSAGRLRAEAEFGARRIALETLAVYAAAIAGGHVIISARRAGSVPLIPQIIINFVFHNT